MDSSRPESSVGQSPLPENGLAERAEGFAQPIFGVVHRSLLKAYCLLFTAYYSILIPRPSLSNS